MDPAFLAHLNLSTFVEVGDCHEWTGSIDKAKHNVGPIVSGRFNDERYKLTVPRLVWLAAGRPIPKGHTVYRTCCNRLCVALDHLACGPRGSALRHRGRVGLAKHMPSTIANLTRAARARPTTKYSLELARQVRELVAAGVSRADVAVQLNMTRCMVDEIARGDTWRESAPASSAFTWRPPAKDSRPAGNAKR